jgi:hypothetical protein
MAQLEGYKKERESLQAQLAHRSEENLQKLETEIVTTKSRIKEVEEENRAL